MTHVAATCLSTHSVRVLLLMAMFASTMLPVRAETDIPHGKALVEANCARCHAIGRTDASTHPDAPAFRILSQRYPLDALEEAFAEGISTGHPDMPEFVAAPDQIGAIIEYIGSLQQP
ncbi:cytochrome c, class I [Mesorhizobium alhagi CCNWXJ12-2]|uniref:Cytochrome c, class I n=2 Tax=Allomesorhizobium alhagi TaxID=475067 RepID=H0I3D6_9HYPH|nr:cytochrome c, class I [Mesorhizobium alhagi CCNWXJ12-2]